MKYGKRSQYSCWRQMQGVKAKWKKRRTWGEKRKWWSHQWMGDGWEWGGRTLQDTHTINICRVLSLFKALQPSGEEDRVPAFRGLKVQGKLGDIWSTHFNLSDDCCNGNQLGGVMDREWQENWRGCEILKDWDLCLICWVPLALKQSWAFSKNLLN